MKKMLKNIGRILSILLVIYYL